MKVGVPKEIKNHEYRVGLVPASVRELTARGHEVFVQSLAGDGIGVLDSDYETAGGVILPSAAEVEPSADFSQADQKVKCVLQWRSFVR